MTSSMSEQFTAMTAMGRMRTIYKSCSPICDHDNLMLWLKLLGLPLLISPVSAPINHTKPITT